MKIALVCGHYIPKLGYIEVHLSKAFALLGHDVMVFTSNAFPAYLKEHEGQFGTNPDGVRVRRLEATFELGQVVIAKGLKGEIKSYDPDRIIVIGLGKRFPKPVFDLNYPVITLLGDNANSYASKNLKQSILFKLFKKSTYAKALKRSEQIIAYTPESFDVVVGLLGPSFQQYSSKLREISLGFWVNEFYEDSELRKIIRKRLGFSESDKVVITATRIVPEKNLEAQIPYFQKSEPNVKWLLVGSSGDTYASDLKNELERSLGNDRFMMLKHVKRSELNGLYNAADLALYTIPAISNFEAVGTGLKLRIPNIQTLFRLFKLDFKVSTTKEPFHQDHFDYDRREAAKRAEKEFNWIEIAKRILVDNKENS